MSATSAPATPGNAAAGPSTVLIIGASRGLGLGLAKEYLARGWNVIGTVRGERRNGLHELADTAGGQLQIETLDIVEEAQIHSLRERLDGRAIDLLFVNAGVANDPGETVAETSTESFNRIMVTNALAPMRVIEAFESLVPSDGMIAAMSSGLGSVANNESGGWEVYRASKAALNTLMRSFGARSLAKSRSIAVVTPGWVRTDMGGPQAGLDVETSVRGMADVLAAQRGQPGLRYVDYQGKTVNW